MHAAASMRAATARILVSALALVGFLGGLADAVSAGEFAMATGDKLQWSPDGSGQYRPMEIDPHDPTGNPWLFGEQFRTPEPTRLPWATRGPAASQAVSDRYEPRPWGEQGRRDRYRDDAERDRLRQLQAPAPARPRLGGSEFEGRRYDLTPRPVSQIRPVYGDADYAVGSVPRTGDSGSESLPEPWGGDARPW